VCGITGVFAREREGQIDQSLLRRMNAALRHRGPDGDGFHVEPGIGLGHRRLSIIDIGGGAQPMYNEDETVVIVFNGEIYNHADLRAELEAEGHVFRSRCDTETILHAWESWGPDCLARLSGMFALALWDRRQAVLLLARDRLGKKPLHYAWTDRGDLVFASELGAFDLVPGLQRALDPAAVADFFALGYIPDPATIYAAIRKLPAAHYMLVAHDGRTPRPVGYWDAASRQGETLPVAEAERVLRDRLDAAVATRMVADVPLGAFLSGGLDSSAVVALAAGHRAAPLDTFTIGFAGAGDERGYAAQVAQRYATRHHAEPAAVDYIDAARDQALVYGEPFGDTSAVPTFHVCALARRHVTVALSGDGGDEVFAGYRRHRWHVLTEGVRRHVPATLRRTVLARLARAYPKLDRAPRFLRAKHTLTELSLDSAFGYYRMLCRTQDAQRDALFTAAQHAATDGHDPGARFADLMDRVDDTDALAQAQYVDINTYLPGDILTKVDRASMANSLEVRCPLLDHDIVRWGLALPPALKLRHGEGKQVLRGATSTLLPPAILTRAKQGFAMALGAQFRRQAGRLRQRLLHGPLPECGLFRQDTIARLIHEHEAGRFDHSSTLWLLLIFEGFLAHAAGLSAAPPAAPPAMEAAIHV
jgi:asparagine synthase (glutamine-hydrolysing)